MCFVCVCVCCWHSRTTLELNSYKNKLVHLCVCLCVTHVCAVYNGQKSAQSAQKKTTAWHAICINFFICLDNNAEKTHIYTHSRRKRKWMPHGQHTLCCSCIPVCVCVLSITDADQNLAPIDKQTETTATTTKKKCSSYLHKSLPKARIKLIERERVRERRKRGTEWGGAGESIQTFYLKRPVCIFYELVVQHNNSNKSSLDIHKKCIKKCSQLQTMRHRDSTRPAAAQATLGGSTSLRALAQLWAC